MMDVIRHRGPDDSGLHIEPGIALGVRRLSIIDVEGGHQPFANEARTIWAMQNGELYNHVGVREDLEREGHSFESQCDTEILPHLYERRGDDTPAHVTGKFAFVVWDRPRRKTLIARDRLGVKPLYYARSGDLLVFGSELKAILQSGLVETILDYEAIDAYLTLGFFPDPTTPLASVRKLSPGHRLIVEGGAIRIERYWEYPQPAPIPSIGMSEAVSRVRSVLGEAVRDRLMSDVPVGAMLSGGLDSTLIVAMMAQASALPIKTFSVGFVESGPDNELEPARRVAASFGTEHHELELSMATGAGSLEDLIWALDEPVADLSAIGFEALSRLASTHVKVALAGQGADEMFGGYSRYVRASVITDAQRVPKRLRQMAVALMGLHGDRWKRFGAALTAGNAVDRYFALRSANLREGDRTSIVRWPLATTSASAHRAVANKAEGTIGNPLADALYLDSRLGLVDDMLLYFDRVSMAHSLEVRVPFLDHRVVELAATIPPNLKVQGRTTKAVLRAVAKGMVPDEVLSRPKVGFFNRAVEGWIGSQLRGAVGDVLLDPAAAHADFIDSGAVRNAVEMFDAPGRRTLTPEGLYALLILEVWLTSFLPRALPSGERTFNRVC